MSSNTGSGFEEKNWVMVSLHTSARFISRARIYRVNCLIHEVKILVVVLDTEVIHIAV